MACTEDEIASMVAAFGPGKAAEAEALVNMLCSKIDGAMASAAAIDISGDVDGAFMLSNAYLVFFMQAGFAMLCAGSVRSKNCMNILLKNVLDACFGAPIFFLLGFGFAYGVPSKGDPNPFIGSNDFALVDLLEHGWGWHEFLFQWAFAAATATIVSGSVAERCTFQAYILYSLFLTGFVYPVVVHWVWCSDGWASAFAPTKDLLFNSGMMDFAGSGVVHMTGGFAGLVGATVMGPRMGRFDADGKPSDAFGGHSMTLVVLGTFCLWFGWYGFNPGSQLAIVGALEIVGRAAVCTTLAGASGGVAALFIAKYRTDCWDVAAVCNGVLAGLVAITAGCSVVEPAAGILAGVCGAAIFDMGCSLLLKLQIDDPLAASPMHGFCGCFGVIFVGLMAKEQYVRQVYPDRGLNDDGTYSSGYGLFYGGGGELLGCQICGVLAIIGWVAGTLTPFFMGLRMAGILRVPMEEEDVGLDISHHGGEAYNIEVSKK